MKDRKRNRLPEYDYSQTGWYYVTICTHKHIHQFGEVKNGEMILNEIGKIADENWKNIENLHEHVEIDYYVIMPNHIHGIIIINSVGDVKNIQPRQTFNVGDAKFASPTNVIDRTKMELSKLIQQYKRSVTLEIKTSKLQMNFKWQRSFYDRIIRNEKELFNIRKYIEQNPFKWDIGEVPVNLDI
jgi:REP element-mobilizing transposase RayT